MTFHLTVIGNPVQHSKSPWIHSEFAKQAGLDVDYTKTQSPVDLFKETVLDLRQKGVHGANVTLPFKEQAYRLCDRCSERAERAKAVNTLQFMTDGMVYGDNTDGVGFIRDVQENKRFSLKNKKLLLLGTGGAARGLLFPLLQAAPKGITVANRTLSKAQLLAQEFSQNGEITAIEFNDIKPEYDVIIDCTPFGAWPLAVSDETISHCSLVYDLKYGEGLTPIVEKAALCGVSFSLDGIGMLIEQAAESFALWTGFRPNTALVCTAMRKHPKNPG
ncbi:MAG: aroE1 [Gammaproteobacteria bacterium]|jgi:shikimate dehydrogenase|nr:aroE1 [Gammaproteobacteria bacterium]